MKPTSAAPNAASAAQKAAQVAAQNAKNETLRFLDSARSQVTGSETNPPGYERKAPQLPDHNQYNETEEYRKRLDEESSQRMRQLKIVLEQEIERARAEREAKQQRVARDQAEQMAPPQPEEKQAGLIAKISGAGKRIRGRLGQIMGQGKSEKGKAAKG